jgi:cyclic beta-1,2-glucan synthetase
MYQAAVQSLLGLRRHGATMSLNPCIPAVWPGYTLEWRIGRTRYRFTVVNPDHRSQGIASATLDGIAVDPRAIPLQDDGGEHEVSIVLGIAVGEVLVGLAEPAPAVPTPVSSEGPGSPRIP